MVSLMGRRIPLGGDGDPLLIIPIPFSLLAAAMAAVIAMFTNLCGIRKKRSNKQPSPLHLHSPPPTNEPALNNRINIKHEQQEVNPIKENETKELPLPPAAKALKETYSSNSLMADKQSLTSSRRMGSRRLSSKFSTKVSKIIAMTKEKENKALDMDDGENENKRKKEKLTIAENSVLIKPIILGERCKVPDEDDDEDIMFDKKGKKIETYHPRSLSSYSLNRIVSASVDKQGSALSRTVSKIDVDKKKEKEEGYYPRSLNAYPLSRTVSNGDCDDKSDDDDR